MGRFMRRGVTEFYWVTTLASLSAPSAATIAAGDRLDTDIAEVSGFTFAAEPIPVPDMATTFTSTIAGGDNVEQSNIMFYERDDNTDISDALAKGTSGYVCIFPAGCATPGTPAAADVTDIWPCDVGSNAKEYTAANEAAKFNVVFNPTAPPAVDIACAA